MLPTPAMNPSRPQLSRYGWRPADPPRRPVLFVNPRSGDGKAARAGLAERARAKGVEAVILAPGQDLAALAREAVTAGADALGMAGGDGSLAVVAAAAAAHEIPFVCVPAGTRNHFALDVGVDRHDLIGALDAFTGGVERQIDMAEVNGRLFLNNVSLGIYGEAVRSPAYRDAKVRTLLEIAAEVMGPSAEAPALRLIDDLGREHHHLAVVLVSNNPYALDRPLARGTRPTLGGGQLGIVVLDAPGDSPLAPGRAWSAPRLEVNAPGPVHAGIDGEAVDLSPPLRVRYPAGGAAGPDLPPPPGRLTISTPSPPGLPTRVMAHFLGTVVAYEALHAHPDLHVYLLVTPGSPLALPRRRQGAFLKRASAIAAPWHRSASVAPCIDYAGRVDHADVRRQLQLARPGLVPAQLPGDRHARELPPVLRL